MSGYVLTLKTRLGAYLDARPFSPELCALPLEQVLAIPLHYGRTRAMVADLFDISPTPENALALRGDLSLCQFVGAGMTAGSLIADGPAGHGAGEGMRGGKLLLEHAGDDAGAAMEDGLLVVRGNCGNNCARRMRRGVIVIQGDAGEHLCRDMRGGTVLLLGKPGRYLARGMNRGALFLRNGPAPVSFTYTGTYRPTFASLLARGLAAQGVALPPGLLTGPLARYTGDPLALGKGEIFLASPQ